MTHRALGKNVFVREIDTLQATYGLIQVQRNEPALMVSGRVESIGPKVNESLELKVGDRVWYKRECGVPLSGDLLSLRQDQIDCVCETELEALGHWYA